MLYSLVPEHIPRQQWHLHEQRREQRRLAAAILAHNDGQPALGYGHLVYMELHLGHTTLRLPGEETIVYGDGNVVGHLQQQRVAPPAIRVAGT